MRTVSILLFGGRQPDSPKAETERICAEGVRAAGQSQLAGAFEKGREGAVRTKARDPGTPAWAASE